jgi:hypothetical protein
VIWISNFKSKIRDPQSRIAYPFTFIPHFGHVPSARACCTPGHIGQSSTSLICVVADDLWFMFEQPVAVDIPVKSIMVKAKSKTVRM